jgi:hypothetical protein
MSNIKKIDISDAASIYAISNTPLFLERKLRIDSAVRLISSLFSAKEILSELITTVLDEPETLQDTVRPYVFLIALLLKGEILYLRKAAKIEAPHYKWFQYIADNLVNGFHTTVVQEIPSPSLPINPHSIARTTSSNTSHFIKIPNSENG